MSVRCAMLLLGVFLFLLPLLSSSEFTAGFEMSAAEVQAASQVSKTCAMDFSKVNYAEVTSVCKGPSYNQEQCCSSFKKMACKFTPQVNDFTSTCPIEFMAYLNYAGNYPNGIFIGRCNSGNNLCS